MQNDLISRNELIKRIKTFTNISDSYYQNTDMLLAEIYNMPTAYDVEKVLADAEEFANSEVCYHYRGCPYRENPEIKCENCGALGVVEIIRNGGKE